MSSQISKYRDSVTTRYRCTACGNLTRFDVVETTSVRAFHHYTVGGELDVEDATVLSHHVDEVVCRWCGHGRSVVELAEGETGAAGATETDPEREEPGAESRIS